MKKTLVFAMAMALGVSATAFAANPFSDLPAGHWAYASVAKLAAAGVVDGYPDGTFKGDKTMTRYEMAQIVAKALAKGAIGADDKLVGEFADELDNLGVRVAKLEKNADNVKITGTIRFSYDNTKLSSLPRGLDDVKTYDARLRTRLFLTGEVNDNWHYVSMLENNQRFAKTGVGDVEDGDSGTNFERAYLTGNIGGANITAGRYGEFIADGNVYDTRVDGIKAVVGKDVKFTAEYGKMANSDVNTFGTTTTDNSIGGKFWLLGLSGKMGGLNLEANYLDIKDQTFVSSNFLGLGNPKFTDDNKIWTLGADYTTGKFNVGAMYLKGDSDLVDAADDSQTGWVAKLSYGEAKASKPGSAGIYAKYYNQGASTVVAHTMSGHYDYFPVEGFKGYLVGAKYAVAKNMVAGIEYYDLKGKESDVKAKTLWSQLVITF